MRIGVIAPAWLPVPPPSYGGTEAVVDGLCRGLAGLGHDVLLVGHPDSTCPVERCSVVPAGDTVPMGRARIELEHALGAYALTADCDVVSDHTVGGPVCAALHPGRAVVATNHNPFNRSNEAIFGAATRHADVVAISRSHAATTTVPIAAVIHHGIDVDTFPEGDGSGGYAAMLTRMAPDKGVHHAVRIAREAGMPLKIAAKMREDREHAYFDEFVRPHLGGGIEYVGEVDAAGKRALLAGAVALLNPIQWDEPFGMAMIEAMACGTPVVGTARGAAPELVVDGVTGFLRASDADLAVALAEVRQLDRAACRRRVAEEFSIERMAANYVRAYEARIERVAGRPEVTA